MHEIGTLLFQLGLRMHEGDIESIDQWDDEPPDATPVAPLRPTLFNHHAYIHDDIYPSGVADMAGYWAENRVLGGVTVFDRQGEQRVPAFPPNAYFHSCRHGVTYRYYQLRDEQQGALLSFLLARNPDSANSPLPILADNHNLVRVNEEHALQHHLYRDEWERKPPTQWHLRKMGRAPRSTLDYPEAEAFINYINANFGTVDVTFPYPRRGAAGHRPDPNEEDGDEEREQGAPS